EYHARGLFPDTCYALDSGGDPAAIPTLTHQQLCDFHNKYYHPENALIILYGNMDIEYCMNHMCAEYLSKFAPSGQTVEIAAQPAANAPVVQTGEYSVADEDAVGMKYFDAAWAMPETLTTREIAAFKVLQYILMSTPASPLYKKLAEAELGEEISGYFSDYRVQASWSVMIMNSKKTIEDLVKVIEDTLQNISKNGLDRDFIQACLNFMEFQIKEEDFGYRPKGLVYSGMIYSSWLYGGDPFENLNRISLLEDIKDDCLNNRLLEGLIDKYLLKNNHRAYTTLTGVLDLDGKMEEDIAKDLAKIKDGMNEDEIAKTIADFQQLRAFQEIEETEEDKACIPLLAISDIKKEIERVPLVKKSVGSANILHSPLATNGIVYSTMFFDTSAVVADKLPVMHLLQYLLTKVPAGSFTNQELTREIKGNLGDLSFAFDVMNRTKTDFTPYALVSAKVLEKNTNIMFDLIHKIITSSHFNDKSQIKNYVLELKAGMENGFVTSGNVFAAKRSMAYFVRGMAYADAVSGLGFYDFVKDLADNFDARFDGLCADLVQVAAQIYRRDAALFSVTCDDALYPAYEAGLADFYAKLSDAKIAAAPAPELAAGPEAFIAASKVQYVVQSAEYTKETAYSGALKVLSSILDNYLYGEIRVKGGAYGYNSRFAREVGMSFGTYRDPHLANSLAVFAAAADFIDTLDISDRELTKFILGTMRGFDRPAMPSHKGFNAAINHILGITDDMRQTERNEILSATLDALRPHAALIRACMAQNHITVVGGDQAINENASIFTNIRKI
ncbi:MAG: insulinase family protein, partial [Defluviitaleaceae bacterium]|nr:insulinase family protein [Defluviitaleaceae bacterium]